METLSPIDRLIAATRRNVEHKVQIPLYTSVINRLRSVAEQFQLPIDVKVVYSTSRKVENVKVAGAYWLIYDQYMGQSINLLNRVFLEAFDANPALIYFHKVLAERLVEVGRLSEALHCGIKYQQGRSALAPKRTDEPWRALLTSVHERFLLYHEFGHRVYQHPDKLHAVREHVQSLIEDRARENSKSLDGLIEAMRNAPAAAYHHQDLEDAIRDVQLNHASEAGRAFERARAAAFCDVQWQEEVFCDIFAADMISNEAILDHLDHTRVLRAVYIGFYHLQALEYLRRFPSLSADDREVNWLIDNTPRVQARAHCLRAHLIFLRELQLRHGASFEVDGPRKKSRPPDDKVVNEEVQRFTVQLMEDQKRHYDVIFDSAMGVCDNLRRNNWIEELGNEALASLHERIASKDHNSSPLRDDELRTVVLGLTGWL